MKNSHQKFACILVLLLVPLISNAATIVVDVDTDGTGSASDCELRDAIKAANMDTEVDGCDFGNGADRIEFDIAGISILLNATLPEITQAVEIIGPGVEQLMIDGDDSYQIFNANLEGSLTIRGLTLFQGLASGGGCLDANVDTLVLEDMRIDSCTSNAAPGGGVDISTSGTGDEAHIRRVTFYNNRSSQNGGAMRLNANIATIEDCLFYQNKADEISRRGGAIAIGIASNVTIRRSTFWKNSARRSGSAIVLYNASGNVTLEHNTFSQNNVNGTGPSDVGGAIANTGTLTMFNNVVAGNTEQHLTFNVADINNDIGVALVTQGYNLIGSNEGSAAVFPTGLQANKDRAGTQASPLDAKLGPLADNGGPTGSSLPQPGSPLLDQGSCPGETRDQRGYSNDLNGLRPVPVPGVTAADDGCDTGATEYLAAPPGFIFSGGFED